jgi:transposase
MSGDLTLKQFIKKYNSNDACFDEIVKLKYSGNIVCKTCQRVTRHYKLKRRPILTCKFCRTQTFPLVDTLFEKSTTSLTTWFYALFILTQTRGEVSAKTLQKELSVSYKTAWRIKKHIYKLMEKNKGDLLKDSQVSKWVIFNTIELKVTRKI